MQKLSKLIQNVVFLHFLTQIGLIFGTFYIFGIDFRHILLHFVAFFHVASLFLYRVDNRKVEVDNKKALELTNSTVFHRGRQQKSSRAGKQNNFFIFQPAINKEISPKNATKHPVA